MTAPSNSQQGKHFDFFRVAYLVSCLLIPSVSFASAGWIQELNPPSVDLHPPDKPIVIAVIDDAVLVEHQSISELIFHNSEEIPSNGVDDDGNGFIDDSAGWDISDDDNDVSPPRDRIEAYYHGTHLAGIIADIAHTVLGEDAADYLRILPVKVLSDRATNTYLKDAYKGVEYALKADADIILAAWAVPTLSIDEDRLLDRAIQQAKTVVAAAGNYSRNQPQFPAAHPGVIAVSAMANASQPTEHANFGKHVNLVAPGTEIQSAGVTGVDHVLTKSGTSQASAMVAATIALLRLQYPQLTTNQIEACLITGTTPLSGLDDKWVAQLGAGKLDISRALGCDIYTHQAIRHRQLKAYQGYLNLSTTEFDEMTWVVRPPGLYKGLRFTRVNTRSHPTSGKLSVFNENVRDAKPWRVFSVEDIPDEFYIPGGFARLVFQAAPGTPAKDGLLLGYRTEPIDVATQFCRDTIYLQNEGIINDNSAEKTYAPNSDCRWQIKAPAGQRIEFTAEWLDTQAGVDKIYFFNGNSTRTSDLMAVFSGNKIPPSFKSWGNEALVWFVSDDKKQGNGWQLKYTFVDAE
ncbi:S8 family serine peptidase [Marinobacterium sp. YM272]|uniref:S8 family serine peptidase n=1 Tax=Marinobacterium sp. YM272 TaxID=3421654 RepID=UPI003D7F8397